MGRNDRSGDPGQVPLRGTRRVRPATGIALSVAAPGRPNGPLAEGENLVVEPPRRLVQTMHALWGEDADQAGDLTGDWEIEPVGDSCRLPVTHDQLSEAATRRSTAAGR